MEKYRTVIAFIVLTPILLLLAAGFTGVGHRFWHLFVIFPWGMTGTMFEGTISYPFIGIAIFQFPFYGFVLDWFRKKNKFGAAFLIVLSLHVVLVVVLLLNRTEDWIP